MEDINKLLDSSPNTTKLITIKNIKKVIKN